MYTLNQLLTIAIVMTLIGIITGAILGNYIDTRRSQGHRLQDRLRKTEENLTDFHTQVTQHFHQTANLMNKLNNCYRDVHEHLVMDAMRLSNVDISREIMLQGSATHRGLTNPQQQVEPPLDYAPRHPHKPGMLSEEYRLKEDNDDRHSFPVV